RVDVQRIEQVEIVHDIVLHLRERRIVSRLAPSGMVGSYDAKLLGPRFCEVEAVDRPCAVKDDERVSLARRVRDGFHAVDRQFLAYESAHCAPPDVRSRGITSWANNVMFFTAFQCGMSATCITLLM